MSAIGALIMFAFFVPIAGEPLAEELPFKTAGGDHGLVDLRNLPP
ncbi:hypothetical protein [Streptomyces sp. NPDC093707]